MNYETMKRVKAAREELAARGKRGSKVTVTHGVKDGNLITTLRLFNVRGRELEAVAMAEPAVAQGVSSAYDGSAVTCRDCGSDRFYSVGRSLDYHHWSCVGCRRATSTLTETGLSR